MVLGILTSIAACPAIIGTTEAVRQGQAQNAREKHRGTKTNLTAKCTKQSSQSAQLDGGMIVLRNHKVCRSRISYSIRVEVGILTDSSSYTSPLPSTMTLLSTPKNSNSNHQPPILSLAISFHIPRIIGVGRAKAWSAPLLPGHRSSTGYMSTMRRMR